jgi:hypothetical protein
LSLKSSLSARPVIYEIVPPRRDTSRFSTELRGIEDVLSDRRIAAINIPELINRRKEQNRTLYSPATIPPEEYAMMIKDLKESIVNIISPRLDKEEFEKRAKKILDEYRIPNLLIVGKERHGDVMPGPSATEALKLLSKTKTDAVALGGICIFDRRASGTDVTGKVTNDMSEQKRVWLKAEAGCDFVTSQITFDPKKATAFLQAYQLICDETNQRPLTVFISISTVPTQGILTLLETLDVVVPGRVRKRLLGKGDMGRESLLVAAEVFSEIITKAKDADIRVPLGLQIEQVGVNSGELSLELLDMTHDILKES